MKFNEFERLVSSPRLGRYLTACRNNKNKAMTLYRANLRLSNRMFSVLSIFEVVLRNMIDRHYKSINLSLSGNEEWLLYSANPGGFYATGHTLHTQQSILEAINDLGTHYSHNKLIAELNFGFWRFQFAPKEFRAAGSTLHTIFVNRPFGTSHTDIFNKLRLVNNIRNRIAHHEPICFDTTGNLISTSYVISHYNEIVRLLQWLNVDSSGLLYGIDGLWKEIHFINTM